MSLEAIEKQLLACHKVTDKEALVRSKFSQPALVGTKKSKISRNVIDRLQGLIKENHRHEATALVLAIAVTSGGNNLLAYLRRSGVLRASRYSFNVGALRQLVRLFDRLHDVLQLSNRWVNYLSSINALYELAPEAKRLRKGLITRLSLRPRKAFKTFLFLVNQGFSKLFYDEIFNNNADLSKDISPEDLASDVSRIIALVREEANIQENDFLLTDEQVWNDLNNTYSHDLNCARLLEKLYEAEILIDGLPYQAWVEDSTITIGSIDPDLEKSVRLGYVQMEIQVRVRCESFIKAHLQNERRRPSLIPLFDFYYKYVFKDLSEIRRFPLTRFAFSLPEPSAFLSLQSDDLFYEEILFLLHLDVESYTDFNIEPFEVAPGILSIDLFKVCRIFWLLQHIFDCKLAEVGDEVERRHLALHSVIVSMNKEQLLSLINIALPLKKSEKILEYFTLDIMDESQNFIDLQYRPFLKVGRTYLLPPSLIAFSNMPRNILVANRLQEKRLQGGDPMQAAVEQALRDSGFKVGVEVTDSKQSKTGDVDLLAYRDGVLYIFECKNAYHPCNPHEMRNSYEHIRKAGKQLTRRQQRFHEAAYQVKIWQSLGWGVPPSMMMIRTAILIANRVFTGVVIDGHPVRQAHEFINVITRGEIRGAEKIYQFWDGDVFSTADLNRYLSTDGLLNDQFASLVPNSPSYGFGSKLLKFDSWIFNLERLVEIFEERYRKKAKANDLK